MVKREATSQPGIFRYQTKSGARYRVVVDVEPGADGRRRQLTRSGFVSMQEAKKARGELLNASGQIAARSVTFGAFALRWLGVVEPTVRPSSYVSYERSLRLYVLPTLRERPLAAVGAGDVQRVQDELLAAGRSAATINAARLVMHLVFKLALRWGLVSVNPVGLVDAPKADAPAGTVWTADECRQFLSATAEDRYGALWAVLLATSMRIGEALALTWGAVDLKSGTVTIRQSLTRVKGGGYSLGEPKTDNARRTIALGPLGVAALGRLPRGLPGSFVFPGERGLWVNPETVRYAFNRACQAAGVPTIRIHDLRHSSITLALESGVPMLVISRRAGHSKIGITADRYAHPSSAMDRDAAAALGAFLGDRDQEGKRGDLG